MTRVAAVRQIRAWTIVVILLLAGCGTERPEPSASLATKAASEALAKGFVEQQRILADGLVTADEYRTSVGQNVNCLLRHGIRVSPPVLNPADGLRFIVESTSHGQSVNEYNQAVGECSLRHLSYVEEVYIASYRPVMDQQLRIRVVSCLRQHGVLIPPHVTTVPEIFAEAGATSKPFVIDCIRQEAKALHPEMMTLVIPQ
ncbi:MAG: hypothetical protein ACT4NY_24020 [Pseudonocardiales bacterium]